MYKGYKTIIKDKNQESNNLIYNKLTKCSKCNKYNTIIYSPAYSNIIQCYFCGNPYYIIKDGSK